jgi:hypothetical protein
MGRILCNHAGRLRRIPASRGKQGGRFQMLSGCGPSQELALSVGTGAGVGVECGDTEKAYRPFRGLAECPDPNSSYCGSDFAVAVRCS